MVTTDFPVTSIRLMAEIRRENHLGCKNPMNNGINYLSTGAGFQPSTVSNIQIPCFIATATGIRTER